MLTCPSVVDESLVSAVFQVDLTFSRLRRIFTDLEDASCLKQFLNDTSPLIAEMGDGTKKISQLSCFDLKHQSETRRDTPWATPLCINKHLRQRHVPQSRSLAMALCHSSNKANTARLSCDISFSRASCTMS